MFGLGWQEMLLILLVILLFFGAKKLPDMARGLGKGIREFKDAMKETQNEIQNNTKESDKKDGNSNNK